MARFRIAPHTRLQEWVADEKGYFTEEGLDYEFVTSPIAHQVRASEDGGPDLVLGGALEDMQADRACEVSAACHWAIGVSASSDHGRMWGRAYSVAPGGIYVPPDSPVNRPEDLARVEIGVGQHSGSHFATLQALEQFMDPKQARLRFTGIPVDRLRLMLERRLAAAMLFGPPIYVLEQHGFRKVLDCSFIVAFLVSGSATDDEMERYVRALARAQRDIDLEPHRYKHYYLRELPEDLHEAIDVRTFGTGERIVVEPYTKSAFESTQRWVADLELLPPERLGRRSYEEAVLGRHPLG